MIVQPTAEQTRHVTRSRVYSGPGFGPRSFECIGYGFGFGLGRMPLVGALGPDRILGMPIPWLIDMAQPGTLVAGKVNAPPDQSGNGRAIVALGADLTYSAAGGPNSQPYCQTNTTSNYLNVAYSAAAPGTAPLFHYGIYRVDTWVLSGAFRCGNSGTIMAITGGSTSGKFFARNGTFSAELAVTASTWARVFCQFANSAAIDRLRIGAADTGTGTAFGNTAGGAAANIMVGTAFSAMSMCLAFDALGVPTAPQIAALDSLYGARFAGAAF